MTENTNETPTRTHKVGLFDIRFIIGALLMLYGLIVVITGLFVSDAQVQKSDGLNINLYAGIGMLVVGGFFAAWARLRPIVVHEPVDEDVSDRPAGH
jgi:hypothetical protein